MATIYNDLGDAIDTLKRGDNVIFFGPDGETCNWAEIYCDEDGFEITDHSEGISDEEYKAAELLAAEMVQLFRDQIIEERADRRYYDSLALASL